MQQYSGFVTNDDDDDDDNDDDDDKPTKNTYWRR